MHSGSYYYNYDFYHNFYNYESSQKSLNNESGGNNYYIEKGNNSNYSGSYRKDGIKRLTVSHVNALSQLLQEKIQEAG